MRDRVHACAWLCVGVCMFVWTHISSPIRMKVRACAHVSICDLFTHPFLGDDLMELKQPVGSSTNPLQKIFALYYRLTILRKKHRSS